MTIRDARRSDVPAMLAIYAPFVEHTAVSFEYEVPSEEEFWQRVQEQYKQDGCSTQNEFIAKAILFYCGYLQSEYAGDFLPKILGETLEAILSMFGDRIGRLLFKQTVEHNVMNHILASDTDIDAATYQKMRGMSYQEVVQTHGQISFPEVLRKEKAL